MSNSACKINFPQEVILELGKRSSLIVICMFFSRPNNNKRCINLFLCRVNALSRNNNCFQAYCNLFTLVLFNSVTFELFFLLKGEDGMNEEEVLSSLASPTGLPSTGY